MSDLKTLAIQSDPIQGEIIEILSPELRAHVQKLIDAAVMKERARCDRLREALTEMMEFAGIIEERCDSYATNLARQALEEAR